MMPIRLSDEQKLRAIEEFTQKLNAGTIGSQDLQVNVKIEIPNKDQLIKPCVYFSPEAWLKMYSLIQNSNKELAWHGTVDKFDNEYYIKEILVYPQTVSAATVTTDDVDYPVWMQNLPDETFNRLRFQGHSHVSMGTTPSAVDKSYYNEMLQNFTDPEEFYIFFIMNKSNSVHCLVYDFAQGVLFENQDVTVAIMFEDGKIQKDWVTEANKQIKEHTTIITSTSGTLYTKNEPAKETYLGKRHTIHDMSDHFDSTDQFQRFGDMSADSLYDYRDSYYRNLFDKKVEEKETKKGKRGAKSGTAKSR